MNAQTVKQEISNIINKLNYKRQYPVGKRQTQELQELGLLEFMPEGFEQGDAKAVLEAATGSQGGFNAHGEGETWSTNLQKAMSEVEAIEETEPQIGDAVHVPEHIEYQHLSKGSVISPPIERTRKAHDTTIIEILQDEMEDEHFNLVMVYTYIMTHGVHLEREQFKLI